MSHRSFNSSSRRRLRACAAAAALSSSAALGGPAPLAPPARSAIEHFLLEQAAGLPGKVLVQVDDPVSGPLPPCPALEPFLPVGVPPWGRFSVGVRCTGARPWTRYLSARVSVEGTYLAATHALHPGEALQPADVEQRIGDLTALPRSVLTGRGQIAGMVAANPIAAGAPVRAELLHGAILVHQGQTVRLQAGGAGFMVTTQGRALANGAVGTPVQVKASEGRILAGIVQEDGAVSVGEPPAVSK